MTLASMTGMADNPVFQQLMQSRAPTGGGGGAPNPGMDANTQRYVQMAKRMAQRREGWDGQEWKDLKWLWGNESGFNPNADNPTSSAYGIPQALTELHGLEGTSYMNNPRAQIRWGLDYLAGRYGSPTSARRGYYGGNLNGPTGY